MALPIKLQVAAITLSIPALLYVGDFIALHLRHDRLGTVTVQRYDAVPEKSGKVEFQFEQPVDQSCVRSMFPHQGYPPCWYLKRHSEQRIDY